VKDWNEVPSDIKSLPDKKKFKKIVSRDFEVCFLVPLDRSDIATPAGTGSF
jgi:hypothetical protein